MCLFWGYILLLYVTIHIYCAIIVCYVHNYMPNKSTTHGRGYNTAFIFAAFEIAPPPFSSKQAQLPCLHNGFYKVFCYAL